MSIRNVLIIAMLAMGTLTAILLGSLGVYSISKSVEHEAQLRVDHDLDITQKLYEHKLNTLAASLEVKASRTGALGNDPMPALQDLKREIDFTILNLCDAEGKPIAGSFPDKTVKVPVGHDPVLRQALEGKMAWGTVVLDAGRLYLEGGTALQNAMTVHSSEKDDVPIMGSALYWWIAYPMLDENGRVISLLYGGKSLNFNYRLVDDLRAQIFGTRLHKGKPLGTVTVFLGGFRVATNVLGDQARRAIGTYVSEEVQARVLQEGESYSGRAWVVDEWYLSGYQPLRDPTGQTIGMLYVGLLESPYVEMRTRLIFRFLLPVFIVSVLAILAAVLIVNRITQPLRQLSDASVRLTKGDWNNELKIKRGYSEIVQLANTFREMQTVIRERDTQLRQQNQILAETNEKLQQANRNYMQMLGFVTHELKSPLAVIQTIISNLVSGLVEPVTEKVQHYLVRIQRNCEELQDMVKNYLDLSRAERGELVVQKNNINIPEEIVEPVLQQTQSLFESRHIQLEVACPVKLESYADAELMRIALANYLTNAAKYGSEGGKARLEVGEEKEKVVISVWNEGPGFEPEEGKKLFGKFSRLQNENTRDKKGSGLGLFLCKHVVEAHGGQVCADSKPGKWARFSLTFPRKKKT